jgi:1,4-dihydroxy-2-naphthoyl-CoA synthase
MQSNKRISRIRSKWVTKKVKTTVPPGQQAAMQASYLLGKSIRQIAREQHRDPATVSKIVKSSEMDRIVLDMREKFFGKLLPRALQSIQFALDEETDGRLGYQVLKDSGVIPNQKEILEERALGRRRTTPPAARAIHASIQQD